jgi:hypothetical protein
MRRNLKSKISRSPDKSGSLDMTEHIVISFRVTALPEGGRQEIFKEL